MSECARIPCLSVIERPGGIVRTAHTTGRCSVRCAHNVDSLHRVNSMTL